MTLQLNPDTTDDYESKSLAQMRQMVFDGLGFITPFTATDANYRENLKNMRVAIVNRLGLAVALLANTDTYTNIAADVYNAGGFAAMSSHPPGVDALISTFINDSIRTLFARIEFDKGGLSPNPALPISGSQTCSIDATAVRLASIATLKAHFGQPDAQAYGQQAEKYLSDLTQRTPPNIVGQINSALVGAHNSVFRRYEMNGLTLTASNRGSPQTSQDIFGALIKFANDYTLTTADGDLPQVDDYPVRLLALANLKTKIGQPDAKLLYDEYEQYMSDVFRRLPPNATSIVNNQLKITQQTLYRKYDLFRMERWWTWSLVAGQRFYGTFGDDNANSIAPTAGLATIGDPVTTHNMAAARAFASVITLRNGKVLIAGGSHAGASLSSVELFDPATGIFTATGSMINARGISPPAILLDDGRVLIAGGSNTVSLAFCEIYDPAIGVWTSTGSLAAPRSTHTVTRLMDGRVLVAGGPAMTAAEVYDPSTGAWSSAGSMTVARSACTATLLPDGTVLVAGGTPTVTTVNTAELYSPTTNSFTAISGTMTAARAVHSAVALLNGKVLIAGGLDNSHAALASAELYDPSTQTFSSTGSMNTARASMQIVMLSNEKVLVSGGVNTIGVPTALADVYDAGTGVFTATSNNMPTSISGATAVSLLDGRVLIPGGYINGGATINTAMLYDPGTDVFTATGNLTAGTVYYQVTAYTANGESLPGTEFFVTGVPTNTAVNISWTPADKQPFVVGFRIYGRVTGGTKQLIGDVHAGGSDPNHFIDEGTVPPDGALPTENNTAGPGRIDPRHVTWVGLSFNDNVWNPLIKGIPPMAFGQNINGVPTNYEIRQALEIWPAPTTTDWKVQIKGYFEPQVFESDDDETTLDWQAIYLQTLADAMPRFRNQKGQPWFNQLEIAQATANAMQYIKRLVAGTHMTARYVPGVILERNAVRPVLVGPYVGYP